MSINRYVPSKKRPLPSQMYLGVGPGWWGVTIVAALAFVWAIGWLLTHEIPAA